MQSFVFYHSGVYYEPTCGNTDADLDHEVLAIGFGTDPVGGDYWVVKVRVMLRCASGWLTRRLQNSWSQNWGDEGFVLMSRLNNNCGLYPPCFARRSPT